MSNFEQFTNGIRFRNFHTTNPVDIKEGEIYRFKAGGVHTLRMCLSLSPLTFSDLGIAAGAVDGASVSWDVASASWKGNSTVLIGTNSVSAPSGSDLTLDGDTVIVDADLFLHSGANLSNPSSGVLILNTGTATYTLPAAQGTANQTLTEDGAGNLSWTTINVDPGETITASNIGGGAGLFETRVGDDLRFKSLTEGTGITILDQGTEILISTTGLATEADYLAHIAGTADNHTTDDITGLASALATATSNAVSDLAYDPSWDGISTVAPSKNAVYDKIETLTSTGTAAGSAFISNVIPTSSGNVGSKVYSSDNRVLDSAVTDTALVTVSVLALPARHNYKPAVTLTWGVHTQVVTMVAGADQPLFTGSAAIDLDGSTVVRVTHEDGSYNTCTLAADAAPVIASGIFVGGYPGSQTELKLADTYQFTVVSDINTIAVEFDNYGSYSAQSFSVGSNTSHTVTAVIANRGNSAQLLGAKVRVQKSTGSWSAWYLSESAGSVDGTNLVNLNNLRPSVALSTITYPASQGALKNSETATVVNSASDYTSISYTSPNGDLSIASDTTFATPKTVTRISGNYNISTNNLRLTAARSQNNSSTYVETIVKIAHVACTVAITTPAARLRSGGSDGTAAQNHTITITANQSLYAAPTLAADLGTWQGVAFAGGPAVWTRSLQITDAMVKGAYSFNSLLATNLAGIQTNTILSGSSYTVGGFVTRTVTLAAFAQTTTMNVEAIDYTKVTLAWSFKPSLTTRAALNSTPPIVDSWCLIALNVNPSTIRVLDTASTDSCSADSTITIQEAV